MPSEKPAIDFFKISLRLIMNVGRKIGYWAFVTTVFLLFWFLPAFRIAIAYKQVEKISAEQQLNDTGGLRSDWQHDKYLDLIRSNYTNNQYQKARLAGVYEALMTVFCFYMPHRIILTLMYLFGLVPLVGKHICYWTNGGNNARNNNTSAALLIPLAWYLLANSTIGSIYFTKGLVGQHLIGTGQLDEASTTATAYFLGLVLEIVTIVAVHLITTRLSKTWLFPILWVVFAVISFLLTWFVSEFYMVDGGLRKAEIAQPEFYRFFLNFIAKHGIDFPKDKVYVTEEFYVNAHFSGMANPRIVIGKPFFMCKISDENENLTDCPPPTLIITGNSTLSIVNRGAKRKFTDEDLMGVLAHELGHWKLHHVGKSLGLGQGMLLLAFAISFGVFYSDIISDVFEIPPGRPQVEHVVILNLFLIKPFFQFVSTVALNAFTRTGEYEADNFAKETDQSDGFASCLLKLHEMSAQLPDTNYLFDWFNHDHPSLVHRLQQL